VPRHQLTSLDTGLIARARQLLSDSIQAKLVTPAQLISIAQVDNALARLPRATDAGVISISIVGPRHNHGDIETHFAWTVSTEGEAIILRCGGYFSRPSTGGDSFTTLSWASSPGDAPQLEDYREELQIVPNLESLMTGVPDLLSKRGGYRLTVEDEGNRWLEDDSESEESEETNLEAEDLPDSDDTIQATGWSMDPVDELEQRAAFIVDVNEVNSRDAEFAHGIDQCGSCRCELSQRGFAVDARMKGQLLWGNFCIACFLRDCEGIGWGKGQLYAKQPDGEWRLVAGFEEQPTSSGVSLGG
jgi:hypothetical protein